MMYDSINGTKLQEKSAWKALMKWVQPLVSDLVWAEMTPVGARHSNTIESILSAINERKWRLVQRLPQYKMKEHWNDSTNVFFCGSENHKNPQTLVMIDVDCSKNSNPKGSPEGSLAFCRDVLEPMFPKIYHESSRGGKGRNAYIVVNKGQYLYAKSSINELFKALESHLKRFVEQYDIADVEIKGTLPEFTWGQNCVVNIKFGMPARLPKDSSRFREIMSTTVIGIDFLKDLPTPEIKGKGILAVTKENPEKRGVGSSTNVPISEDSLARLQWFKSVAARLMPIDLKTSSRAVATSGDMGIFLMLLETFSKNMNEDGSLPTKRIQAVWQSLFEVGSVDRPHQHKRVKVLRDHLSSLGLLSWEDETYQRSTVFNMNGKGTNGQACCWKASNDLLDMLVEIPEIEGKGILAVTKDDTEKQKGPETSDFVVPVMISESFDYLIEQEKIDRVVKSWQPKEMIA